MKLALLSLGLLLLSTLPLHAAVPGGNGGSDDCSTPEPMPTGMLFDFDLTVATTGADGQANALCYSFGSAAIENDVWFSWVAEETGLAVVTNCDGLRSIDSRIAVYEGSDCPVAPAIACNDDGCVSGQSRAIFPAQRGSSYLIQIGNAPGAEPDSGNIFINVGSPTANDECSAAIAISGENTYGIDLTTATAGLEGQGDPLCGTNGPPGIGQDVWYEWTAPITGAATVQTCGNNFFFGDTKFAAYEGPGCPTGPPLGCNDDACDIGYSRMSWPVVAGNVYTLQVGIAPGETGYFGTFDISVDPAGGTGANACFNATSIFGEGTFDFDTSNATQGTQGQVSQVCDLNGTTNFDNDVWFDWTCYQYGIATISTCGNTSLDTRLAVRTLHEGPGCLGPNPPLVCSDDACGEQSRATFIVRPGVYKLQLGTFPGTLGGPGTFDISVQPTVGANYCEPAVPNSSGASSRLVAAGSTVVANNDLTLAATDLPQNQTTLFLASRAQGFVAAPGCCTVGNLCLGGDFARFSSQVRNSGLSREVTIDVDLTNIATNPPQTVLAGQTWNFQAWHRDFGGTGNLTQGVEVTFN